MFWLTLYYKIIEKILKIFLDDIFFCFSVRFCFQFLYYTKIVENAKGQFFSLRLFCHTTQKNYPNLKKNFVHIYFSRRSSEHSVLIAL